MTCFQWCCCFDEHGDERSRHGDGFCRRVCFPSGFELANDNTE